MELRGHEVIVIDDGSPECPQVEVVNNKAKLIRTYHEGKRGHWKKWFIARQIALGSDHDYFLFLQDDLKEVDLETIKKFTVQGWDKQAFAINLLNIGHSGWGQYEKKDQKNVKIDDCVLSQCGYVDCIYLTNRTTLESIEVEPVPYTWHDRPNKSSGVGYYMTGQMRLIEASMMLPNKSLAYHGKHPSQMHKK